MTLENEPMIAQPPLFRAGVVDTRINNVLALLPPVAVIEKFPTTEEADKLVCATRQAIHDAMKGESDRLVVITGPCSIHDPRAAIEYADGHRVLGYDLATVHRRAYFLGRHWCTHH